MKVIPTKEALCKTVWWTLFVGSLFVNVIALWAWAICNAEWDDILETAKLNDLDGDGRSVVEIQYK